MDPRIERMYEAEKQIKFAIQMTAKYFRRNESKITHNDENFNQFLTDSINSGIPGLTQVFDSEVGHFNEPSDRAYLARFIRANLQLQINLTTKDRDSYINNVAKEEAEILRISALLSTVPSLQKLAWDKLSDEQREAIIEEGIYSDPGGPGYVNPERYHSLKIELDLLQNKVLPNDRKWAEYFTKQVSFFTRVGETFNMLRPLNTTESHVCAQCQKPYTTCKKCSGRIR